MNVLEYILENRLVLIPVLMIIGWIVKQLRVIGDKYIPLILLGLGILFSVLLEWDISVQGVVQGVLVTGAAVLGNQIPKQLKKR